MQGTLTSPPIFNVYISGNNLDNPGEVLPIHVVVSFEEHLAQTALSNRVILCVELVEAMERVTIL